MKTEPKPLTVPEVNPPGSQPAENPVTPITPMPPINPVTPPSDPQPATPPLADPPPRLDEGDGAMILKPGVSQDTGISTDAENNGTPLNIGIG